jgi:hypothetical protein
MKTYKITHLVNDRQQIVAVDARDVNDAQEVFIAYFEGVGMAHGAILSIRAA